MNEREQLIHAAAVRILVEAVVGVLVIGMIIIWSAILIGILHG